MSIDKERANAIIKVPGIGSDGPQSFGCVINESDGRRLEIIAQVRVPAFTPVTIEHDDALFLGEVIACTQDIEHAWHVEIKVEQILTGLQSLMNLRANLLGEPMPAPLSVTPATVGR